MFYADFAYYFKRVVMTAQYFLLIFFSKHQHLEGYVASQVEKVIPAHHTWIITFSDGSVYTYNGAYTRIDYLSDLYSEGHIKDFYLYNQNIWNDEYDIVLWMADNGLYKYIW
jgi:hypothetical protein